MTWAEAEYAAIDFESAGKERGSTEEPVQIGIVTWNFSQGIQERFCRYLRVNAGVKWSARKVHGITEADLLDAPSLIELWVEIKSLLAGKVILSHGQGTEKKFLRAFPGHGFHPWVDTLTMSKKLYPNMDSYALGDLCRACGLESEIMNACPNKTWHDAEFDATASLFLFREMVAGVGITAQQLPF